MSWQSPPGWLGLCYLCLSEARRSACLAAIRATARASNWWSLWKLRAVGAAPDRSRAHCRRWCYREGSPLQGGGFSLGFKSLRLHPAARVRSPDDRSLRKIRMSLTSYPTTSPRPSPNGCGSPAAPSPRWAPRPSSRRWPATWTASIRCGRLAAPLPPNFSDGGDIHKARAGGLLGPTPAATSRGQRCCLALWQARAPSDPV